MSRLSGLAAKRQGSAFEEVFQRACQRSGVAVTRIPDGCKRVGPKRLIQVKSPFDWILTYQGKTVVIDTKSTANASFSNSGIDGHQVQEMLKHTGGYVVWLRLENQVIFVPATRLATLYGVRGSIGWRDAHCVPLGPCGNMDVRKIFEPLGGV